MRGVAWTKTRRSTRPSAIRWSPGRRIARPRVGADRHRVRPRSGARPSSSRGRRRSTRGARRRGRRASRSGPRRRSSDGAGRRLMSSAASSSVSSRIVVGDAPGVERVDVRVAGEDRDELRLVAGQDVDDAARHVGRGEDLGQGDRRQRPRLAREQHDRVARHERRGEPADEPQQRRGLRRDDADDAGRLGDREVEVRRRDRVGRAEHLGDLVGPAGVPDPAVDGAVDDLAGPARAGPRRPRPRPRTGRAGPP